MIAKLFCSLVFFLLLHACAQTIPPMQQELSNKIMPMYEGRFSPLQTPFYLQYRPVAMKLAGQLGIYRNVRDKDEVFSGELHGRLTVSPAGDSFLWEFKLENAVMGEEKISSGNSPLMEFRARRDKQGALKDAEIAPVAMHVNSPEERRRFQDVTALVRSQFRSLSAQLPASPIREGNLLLEIDMNSAVQDYEWLWGSPRCSPPKEKIGYAVRGLGSFKGRKVIVAAIEEDFICVASNDRRYNFGLHGYALLDTETGQILEQNAFTTVKPFYSFSSVEVRTLQKVSAEVIE